MPAPITAPERDLLNAVIFNPPLMLSNLKLTAQLDLGSSKTGHWASKQASTFDCHKNKMRTQGARVKWRLSRSEAKYVYGVAQFSGKWGKHSDFPIWQKGALAPTQKARMT
jgi:hypothetical protein